MQRTTAQIAHLVFANTKKPTLKNQKSIFFAKTQNNYINFVSCKF